MNVNIYYIKDYQIFIPLAGQKNKPNSNPIKPNFQKAKMNANVFVTKDYRKNDDFAVQKNKPNSNPISPTPKGVKQKSDAGSQRSDICLLPSGFCLLSIAPMVAIGFDYNGIFVNRLSDLIRRSPVIICLMWAS